MDAKKKQNAFVEQTTPTDRKSLSRYRQPFIFIFLSFSRPSVLLRIL